MAEYPSYIDGKPPTISLKEYDIAPWNGSTCVDRRNDGYYVVVMEKPEQLVAKIDSKDSETMDRIFSSAHKTYAQQYYEQKSKN